MAESVEPDKSKARVYKSVYSQSFLARVYDRYVLGFNMKYMWGCGTQSVLLPFFGDNFSRRHMDVGVATGFFPAAVLSRPIRNLENHQLTLVDFNETSLNAAKARVLSAAPRATVECVQADVTAPLPEALRGQKFETITMFNLFHCMPGGGDKLRAISTYKDVLTDSGSLTGCSVLGKKHTTGVIRHLYLKYYNWADFFNNWDDEREAFEKVLRQDFEEVETTVVGMMMLWKATKPRRGGGDSQQK